MTKEERIRSISQQLNDRIYYNPSVLDIPLSPEAIILNNQIVIMKALFTLIQEI